MKSMLGKLAMEVFNSGTPIGYKTTIKEATGWLRNHSKGVGEELGNALNGRAKKLNDILIKCDVYNKVFAHLDDVAKQYPEATVQVAAKNAKKGGYKVGKISIKNGDETIYKQAISITEDGAVKTKANSLGSELTESMDIHGGQVIGSSEVGTVRAKYDLAQEKGQLELINGDKQVAIAKYENKGGTATRGGFTYETVDDTISGQMYYNNHEVSFSGNTGELKSWGIRYQAEAKKQKEKIAPLVLEILRPLRERFNTAIDLFKYNGRTNFERFLSKDELAKCTEGKAIDLESLKRTKDLPTEKMEYLRQIKSDIAQAEKLIEISV